MRNGRTVARIHRSAAGVGLAGLCLALVVAAGAGAAAKTNTNGFTVLYVRGPLH